MKTLFAKILQLISDAAVRAYDSVWTYCDPVTKVCYTHIAHHYEHKYRKKFPVHHSKVFYFDMFLLALLSFLLVAWFFVETLLPFVAVPQLVRIQALSPDKIVSGEDSAYVYKVSNDSDGVVGCAVLRIQLPAGTFLTEELRQAGAEDRVCSVGGTDGEFTWEDQAAGRLIYTLNNLDPHSSQEVHFAARTFGATGEAKPMTAELTYWEESAVQSSRLVSRVEREIGSSVLTLGITLPEGIERGRAQTLTVSYRAARALGGAAIRIAPPSDFVITGSAPAFTGAREWRLGSLAAGTAGTLTVNGYFKAVPEAQRTAQVFTLRGYVSEGAAANVLTEAVRVNADPRAADLVFTQEMLTPHADAAVAAGGTVRVAVHYSNQGQRTLRDLRITVDAGAPFVAGLSADAHPAVIFDRSTESGLGGIDPGESGTLIAEFPVKSLITAQELGALPYPALHVTSRAEYFIEDGSVGGEPEAVRLESETADVAIATRLALEAAALYYTKDGDQLGVGPLPPVVGQETKYRVFLSVSATTGIASGAVVEATLPEGVRWAGGSSVNNGSAIDYLPMSRRIRWQAGDVPAFSGGSDASRIGATFEVGITPTAEQVGTSPLLLTEIDAHAVDAATGAPVHADTPIVSTELPYDVRAAGKGAVVEAENGQENPAN